MLVLLAGLGGRNQSSDSSIRCHIEIWQNACIGESHVNPQTGRLRLEGWAARRVLRNHQALVTGSIKYPLSVSCPVRNHSSTIRDLPLPSIVGEGPAP